MRRKGSGWGPRWIASLERLSPVHASRIARGKAFARTGRVHDVVVSAGRVTARVTQSPTSSCAVSIEITRLGPAQWARTIAAVAGQVSLSAELLAGHVPDKIDEAFEAAGASLLPVKSAELLTSCNCGDFASPCKHVAAAQHALGDAMDRDPFLLFELRGRTRAQVLAALRVARSGEDPRSIPGSPSRPGSAAQVDRVSLANMTEESHEAARGALPELHVSFEAPGLKGAVISQLGAPGAWRGRATPAEALAPLVRAAAKRAREIALATEEPEDDTDPSAPMRPRPVRKPR